MGDDQTEKAELLIITDQVFDGSGIDTTSSSIESMLGESLVLILVF